MQQDICYICHQRGHWSWYCPFKSPNHDSSSTPQIPANCSPDLVRRMQQDICYVCNKRGHWSWYCPSKSPKHETENVPARGSPNLEERMRRSTCYNCRQRGHWSWNCPSPSKSPNTKPSPKHESDLQPPPFKCERVKGTGTHDFACPKQDHGSCGYRVPEDQLSNSKSIVPIQQSTPKTLNDFGEGCQNEKIDNGLGNKLCKGDGLQVQIKNIRITNYSGNPSSMAVLEIPHKEGAGSRPMGWLGHLLFFYPTKSLKFLTPQPFFCCIFPSYNPIVVPKQTSIPDGPVECNQLAISSVFSQQTQLSTGCHTVVSGDIVSPSKSQVGERKCIMSKVQRHREVVLFTQQQLLIDLETLDPREHQSMKNSLTMEELNKLFDGEKMRFAQLQDEYVKTKALLEASNRHRQLLCEQVSILKTMLDEKQNQLKFCELETLKIKTRHVDLKRRILETDITLKEKS